MSNTVEWHKLEDERPGDNLFWNWQWVCTTDGRVITGLWVGDDKEIKLLPGQSIIDGYLRGGLWFTGITHWAYIQQYPPLPPNE